MITILNSKEFLENEATESKKNKNATQEDRRISAVFLLRKFSKKIRKTAPEDRS